MRSGGKFLLKIAFALCGATAFSLLHAADSNPAPAPAPEKIEFSRTTSTTPKVPRPGAKNEEMLNRFGNVPTGGGSGTEITPMVPPTGPVFPSKKAAEKYLRDLDRKKNWMVPGAQDDFDSTEGIEKTDEFEKDWDGPEKNKTVMQNYISGDDPSKRTSPQARGRDGERDRERDRDRRNDRGESDRRGNDYEDSQLDDEEDSNANARRDQDDNSESNGLAEFNLKNYIRAQNGAPNLVKDNPLPRASQLFRSEIGTPNTRQTERERTEMRERDAARSAAFMQMITPRASGTLAGGSDPINAPDLTRREMNPVVPRSSDSVSERSPFATPPPTSSPRLQDNNMFGVTGPAASSMAPAASIPAPRTDFSARVREPIIREAPKRPF